MLNCPQSSVSNAMVEMPRESENNDNEVETGSGMSNSGKLAGLITSAMVTDSQGPKVPL